MGGGTGVELRMWVGECGGVPLDLEVDGGTGDIFSPPRLLELE